ncbi:1-acyl-sn-glycerol-3-phosphate acyltransferase [Halopseudomonas nanhaiensis]|nr:1-acyl-sn-glycerol-3-phosphate acyltransferase [Halopseudomonas nanhaiensis]
MVALAAAAARVSPGQAAAFRARLCQLWMTGLVAILPLQVRSSGNLPRHPALWVSNHISWLDIVLLGRLAPLHFLSKAEVAAWPVIGWLARGAGTLFIERGTGSSDLNGHLAQTLEARRSLVIFPEGTTTAGDRVRTFHGRLLGCAVETATPLQPVAIAYRSQGARDTVAPFIGDDEFTTHLWRLLGSDTIEVEIRLLPPILSAGAARNQLARDARQVVAQTLGLDGEPEISASPSVSRRAA